uniref:Calmodulin-lysine N-methyltransferase n=1 Tax=Phallusia mammillata TaxID=59560 RepID=A0A6F9D7P7_9ASCI|nr:calmodulin-lysine N-methyltransferase-like [Phallusia mammillata]
MSKSQARWDILRNAIVEKKLTGDGDSSFSNSVRRFGSFDLFARKQCNCVVNSDKPTTRKTKEECRWFSYTCQEVPESLDVWIQHPEPITSVKDVLSFNNTGNVCIWPAEEVMAYYCVLHMHKFRNRSVLELGGGSTCLAGMNVALNCKNSHVLLSDGNVKCVESLQQVIEMNTKNKNKVDVSASVIRWDNPSHYQKHEEKFDYILCADCLFFDEHRPNLVDATYAMLKPEGTAFVFAPRRGNTLATFVDLCMDKFSQVSESDFYCPLVSLKHERARKNNQHYDPDLHFPIMVELMK